jgi:nucleotide-binding universal stress UspA family protein
MKKILVATDGSEKSKHAMEEAASLAKAFDAEITVISVSQDTQFYIGDQTFGSGHMFVLQEDIEKAVKQILKRASEFFAEKGLEVKTVLGKGYPADVICETAEEGQFDLIVLGSRGLGSIKGFILGSVSSRVAHHCKKNVLIVK